ncbi:MAG TPA: hypothetical protein DCQ99_07815 [Nitrospinae bacterium]|nr:hypothetical protein [Nitrospinota bacterium]HBA26835.1 hypothetical protein [Nitrospinota bacterium]
MLCYGYDQKGGNVMGKEIRIIYDEAGDILDMSIGEPEEAISREVEDDFFIRIKQDTGEVVGFSILNFRKWFKNAKDIKILPVKGELVFS